MGARMADCPNSTEGGCRCPQHHPGLGYEADDLDDRAPAPVLLSLVTAVPPAPELSEDEILARVIERYRSACPSCRGDKERCLDGHGPPTFRRLNQCAAYGKDGQVAVIKARPQPRQPWEPKVRRAA